MKSAVVLAAGEGSRAWPFAGIRQKVTVPILNVPMVRRLVLDLRALGIEDIVTVVGHRAEAVRACLADLPGVRFVPQPQLKGPVDAALLGLAEIASDTVLLCYADIVTSRETLKAALEAFAARKADALLLLAPCPEAITASWTTVHAAPDGLVSEIGGKGGAGHPRFAGVALAKTDLLKRYLLRDPGIRTNAGVGAMPPLEGDIPYAFDLMRDDHIEVHSSLVRDFFVDVDKPWHILEANTLAARHTLDALDRTVISEGATIDDSADIRAGVKLWLGPGARIGKGCRIDGPVVLGPGAQVVHGAILEGHVTLGAHSRCEDYAKVHSGSVLGEHCVVGHCAEFEGVLFDVVFLYHYSCVTALIGTHVDVGAAAVCGTWRFDDGCKTQVVNGHEEIPECFGEYTYIGDYCRVGVNAVFMPGVKVGYYSCVGPGVLAREDIPERTMLLAKQEQVRKPWGPEKYGW